MNDMRHDRAWLTLTFDERCRLSDRSMQFGYLPDAARNLYDASVCASRPFDIACAMFLCPSVAPSDLKAVVDAMCAISLPRAVARLMTPAQRLLWNSREPGE